MLKLCQRGLCRGNSDRTENPRATETRLCLIPTLSPVSGDTPRDGHSKPPSKPAHLFHREIPAGVQPAPPLAQLAAISSCPSATWGMVATQLPHPGLQQCPKRVPQGFPQDLGPPHRAGRASSPTFGAQEGWQGSQPGCCPLSPPSIPCCTPQPKGLGEEELRCLFIQGSPQIAKS